MTIIIKKGITKKEIEQIKKELFPGKAKTRGLNTKKYLGKVKFKGDPVKIQRKLRNEWE